MMETPDQPIYRRSDLIAQKLADELDKMWDKLTDMPKAKQLDRILAILETRKINKEDICGVLIDSYTDEITAYFDDGGRP